MHLRNSASVASAAGRPSRRTEIFPAVILLPLLFALVGSGPTQAAPVDPASGLSEPGGIASGSADADARRPGERPAGLDQSDYGTRSGVFRSPSRSLATGDPISAASGAYHFEEPLLDLGGPMDLEFKLLHNTHLGHVLYSDDGVGLPWRFWYSPLVQLEYKYQDGPGAWSHFVSVQFRDGGVVSFKREDAGWILPEEGDFDDPDNVNGADWRLEEVGDYFYLRDPFKEWVYLFEKVNEIFARTLEVRDRVGNKLVFSYEGEGITYPRKIEDNTGRWLSLSYEEIRNPVRNQVVLTEVTDHSGRAIRFEHRVRGTNQQNWRWHLLSVTDAMGGKIAFEYPGTGNAVRPWVAKLTRPMGNAPVTQQYDFKMFNGSDTPVVTRQDTADGHTYRFDYSRTKVEMTETRPDGSEVRYAHHSKYGWPVEVEYPDGKKIEYSRDAAKNRVTGLEGRNGDAFALSYHAPSGKLASLTDMAGSTTTHTYAEKDQEFTFPDTGADPIAFTFYELTRIDHGDGSHEAFERDAKGQVVLRRDRRGGEWRMIYDERGNLLTRTNPAGGVETSAYNADSTLATRQDADLGERRFAYDTAKRLVGVTLPDDAGFGFEYDPADRPIASTDALGERWQSPHNPNHEPIGLTNPLDQSTEAEYDAMDRVTRLRRSARRAQRVRIRQPGAPQHIDRPLGPYDAIAVRPQ